VPRGDVLQLDRDKHLQRCERGHPHAEAGEAEACDPAVAYVHGGFGKCTGERAGLADNLIRHRSSAKRWPCPFPLIGAWAPWMDNVAFPATLVDVRGTTLAVATGPPELADQVPLAWRTMRLTVIGCAGSFPGPDSPASCYLVEADGFRMLLDLGNGALGGLQRHVGLFDIDAICLSHLHGDHCLDMAAYWVARTYAPDGPRPRIPVYGPAGTAERLAGAQGRSIAREMSPAFAFETLTPGASRIGPFEITVDHMNHPVETFAFRLEQGGRALAYSADTGESAALVRLARGADLLLCEASCADVAPSPPGWPGSPGPLAGPPHSP